MRDEREVSAMSDEREAVWSFSDGKGEKLGDASAMERERWEIVSCEWREKTWYFE